MVGEVRRRRGREELRESHCWYYDWCVVFRGRQRVAFGEDEGDEFLSLENFRERK